MQDAHHGNHGRNKAMKVVILAGGLGTRLGEETRMKPKPMVEVGDKPILWHIMKIYSSYGFNDFIVCCGYKGHMIKDYFLHYYMYQSDMQFGTKEHSEKYLEPTAEPWRITLADTGQRTLTAGRILKIKDYIGDDESFMLTYGDGVGNVNIPELIKFHEKSGKMVTISTTQPEGRFGAIKFQKDTGTIEHFKEKARKDQSWVNIGFMVMNRGVFDYLGDGSEMLEKTPFEKLAADEQMAAYQHTGFWSPMDNIHDRGYLQGLWDAGEAPWKTWE